MLGSYTPQEVAAVAGAPLAMIQKAITARRVPARMNRRSRRRELDRTAVLAFALVAALPPEFRLSPGDAYRLLKGDQAPPPSELAVGGIVRIDTGTALAPVEQRLQLYERARELVISDPAIMGGTPVLRGTRITAQAVLGRLTGGDTVEDILDDYPYLTREMVEAAALYAQANPPRGRPAGRLWHSGS